MPVHLNRSGMELYQAWLTRQVGRYHLAPSQRPEASHDNRKEKLRRPPSLAPRQPRKGNNATGGGSLSTAAWRWAQHDAGAPKHGGLRARVRDVGGRKSVCAASRKLVHGNIPNLHPYNSEMSLSGRSCGVIMIAAREDFEGIMWNIPSTFEERHPLGFEPI